MKVNLGNRSSQGDDKERDPLNKCVAHIAKFAIVLISNIMSKKLVIGVL